MYSTPSRLLRVTNSIFNAAAGASCATSSKAGSVASSLPPIRYHVFRNPLPYDIGLNLQNEIIERRLKRREGGKRGGRQDVVLLLEHTPTYTTGRRDNSPNPDTLHPEEKKVQNVGANFYITKRGGQVTYHGPGQLVGYPILDLTAMETPTRCYVDWLQALLADYVRDHGCEGILAPHPDGHVGVFASPTEKVASIGIHLRHRITSHGFAINITQEPIKWFDLVLACGLADVRAVCLNDLISRGSLNNGVIPSLTDVRPVAEGMIPRFEKVFSRPLLDLNLDTTGEGDEEVEEIRGLVKQAEEDAAAQNKRDGGWPTEPDLSKREL